jgi:hypothetical protein
MAKPKPNEPNIQTDTNIEYHPAAANRPAKIIPLRVASTLEGALAAAKKSVDEANKS